MYLSSHAIILSFMPISHPKLLPSLLSHFCLILYSIIMFYLYLLPSLYLIDFQMIIVYFIFCPLYLKTARYIAPSISIQIQPIIALLTPPSND